MVYLKAKYFCPLLVLIYLLPLGQIRQQGLNFHSYAHDIQIYFTINPLLLVHPLLLFPAFRNLKT